MACPRRDQSDDGYATPAAILISLALAIAAGASLQAATMELRHARADLRRAQAELVLAGAQNRALADLIGSPQRERLHWRIATDEGSVEVLAEPEAAKVGLAAGAVFEDAAFARLGVADAERVRTRLRAAALSLEGARTVVREADPSPVWRACALSLFSPYGRGSDATLAPASVLAVGDAAWRPGEVWRVRVSGAGGWADDRLVRFTGSPERPAAVIERQFTREGKTGEPCESWIEAAGG